MLLTLVLQALYGAVDLWAVGKFGTTADISAVSTGSQTMQIVTGIVTGLSMGTTVLLGQRIGQKDDERAAQVVGTSIRVFTALGIALSFLMVLAAKTIAHWMNAPEEAFSQTVHYIRICGGGSLCIVAYNLLSAIFRGMGDSKSPLVFVSIACVTNIVGDITLIDGFKMGAAGAAIATVAAQAVSVVLSVILIRKKDLPFHFAEKQLDFHKKTAAVLGGIMAYAAYFHGDALSMIFVSETADGQAAVIRDSAEFLRATSIECFVLSVACCLTGYFNGLGRTTFVMLQGLCAIFFVKIPYAYFASQKPEPKLFDIGLSTAYAALFTLTVCLIYYVYSHRRPFASKRRQGK